MRIKEVLLASDKYRAKANCIWAAFEAGQIYSRDALNNAPRILGHICGEDIYHIVSELNALWDSAPEIKGEPDLDVAAGVTELDDDELLEILLDEEDFVQEEI